jgi:hypothetical protein
MSDVVDMVKHIRQRRMLGGYKTSQKSDSNQPTIFCDPFDLPIIEVSLMAMDCTGV